MSDIKEELAKRASNIRKQESGNEPEPEEAVGGTDGEKAFVRLLRAGEIECWVSTINERGLSLLLFKDARVDQKILDETFTPFGWKRTHQIIDGNLYCTVEIWDSEKCQWIAKQDVGTTSYSEKEKGQASDSFKRACFNWGVGRELYTAPFIWIGAGNVAIQKKDNKFTTSDRFSVQSISYNEQREINALVIVNGKGFKVFEMKPKQKNRQDTGNQQNTGGKPDEGQEAEYKEEPSRETGSREKARQELGNRHKPEENWITDMQKTVLEQELKRTGVSIENVLARYKIHKLEQMTPEIYTKALNGLRKSKTKEAA
mgnify:FL=1